MAKSCRQWHVASMGTARKSCHKKPATSMGIVAKRKPTVTGVGVMRARAKASIANVSPMFYHNGNRFVLRKDDLDRLVRKITHQSRSYL